MKEPERNINLGTNRSDVRKVQWKNEGETLSKKQ
jgi:hypothetical protein